MYIINIADLLNPFHMREHSVQICSDALLMPLYMTSLDTITERCGSIKLTKKNLKVGGMKDFLSEEINIKLNK